MDFVKFSSATCKVFPIANSKSGGQLVNEYNLRARESVGTDPRITYTSYPSYTHDANDFVISAGQNQNSIAISAGQCILNGHYFESEAPIEIDLLGRGLSGKLKIGLRAYYSTDTTLSGSMVAEDSNYMLAGIRVVILPENEFVLPIDSPDDESAVTAHLLLGSFTYNDRVLVDTIAQNEDKTATMSADRISGLGEALDGKYITANAIYPSGIFTMEGRGSTDGSIVSRPTWSNSTNSLMLWDNSTEVTTTKPTLQSAQFNTYPSGDNTYTILQIPHKQIEGYFEAVSANGSTTYRRLYFPTKNLSLPLADFDRGTAGTVDRNYTNKIKNLAKKFDTIYLLPNGKQRAFIEEISSLEDRPKQLPPINGNWNYGDYVLVRNDLSLDWATDGDSTISTMYVVLGPYVSKIEYAGEVYQTGTEADYKTALNALITGTGSGQLGLTGTNINSAGINESSSLVNSSADFAGMYYTNSIAYLRGKKVSNKYKIHTPNVLGAYAYSDVSEFSKITIIGSLANDNIDLPRRTVRLNASGDGYITNNTSLDIIGGNTYTLRVTVDGTTNTYTETLPSDYAGSSISFDSGAIVVSGGDTIQFSFSDNSLWNKSVEVQMNFGNTSTISERDLKYVYLVQLSGSTDTFDVYIYTGDANVGINGYVKRCSAMQCSGLSTSESDYEANNTKITQAIENYIANDYATKVPLTDETGAYVYRLSTKANGTVHDYMTLTYTLQSNNTEAIKYMTQVFTIPYSGGISGTAGYSSPIVLTGDVFLATPDAIGGFYNIDATNSAYTDSGYVYVDAEGHLRLLDYELLRSAELAYILSSDKAFGEGLTYEEIQYQLDEEVNNRVAFPMQYTENTELNQFVINIVLTLPASEGAQTITINNIDQRYGTAVILTIKGEADDNTTINIVNCNKIKINPNISGTPIINVINSGICYDATVFNSVTGFQNISLWYERYSESDPNLVVNGMTVTDLDVASFVLGQDTNITAYLNQENLETVQYELTFGDYNFSYGLRSITIASDGSVAGVGIYVKNQSSTQSTISIDSSSTDTSRLYLAKFRLPQSINLQYPISRIGANIRIDGSFISGYQTTDNNKYILATSTFSAMVNQFDITDTTSYEESSGIYYAVGTVSYKIDSNIYSATDISVDSDVILSTNVQTAMDAVLRSFDNNAYHIFDGHSIPVID